MKRKRLMVVSPDERDANSFYRCYGPLNYMEAHSDIELMPADLGKAVTYSWVQMTQVNAVFMHRPVRPDDLVCMQLAYLTDRPIWVDYDDWLFGIPDWNPSKPLYLQQDILNCMAIALACASVVTTTVKELADLFRVINPNTILLPNAYRSDLYPYRVKNSKSVWKERTENLIMWRGTQTHDGDLLTVLDAFNDMAPPWKVEFMGGVPWQLNKMDPACKLITPPMQFILYHRHIFDRAPSAFIVPLYDNKFNRCKSNIAYIEAMHAGAITIAPELPEFIRPGVFTYPTGDNETFYTAIDQVLSMKDTLYEEYMHTSFKAMLMEYDISVVNEARTALCNQLMDGKFPKGKSPLDATLAKTVLTIVKEVLHGMGGING